MPRTYIDDFIKLPITKMAQAISDMTFAYQETKVPKEHYKKLLGKSYEELVETTVSVKLVETIYNGLSGLQKESPRLFFQAFMLLDLGIKPSALTASQYQALTVIADTFENTKQKHMLDTKLIEQFKDIDENGVMYQLKRGQSDED
ncbi:hypothetical protein JK159_02390 [Weissella minor]|uniref:hypothetical protein n=1 Tax=Weissella minor TaxID=1620 RepID=UPI001BAFD028|nr:hypothetical protein [Weissella minor]MBS0949232.1 hypothetical protein [Weissella minor]